ncbi:Uncharacterized protein SCF082_LOCUS40963 [Durusdinium trenchii]|uniref:Endonuclease/exonuclease/phosphatase domain-containing protein n=1 Tax=Durusdinium trenchii TaxID=1381693 RepID=A0ABP0QEF3_9DINO
MASAFDFHPLIPVFEVPEMRRLYREQLKTVQLPLPRAETSGSNEQMIRKSARPVERQAPAGPAQTWWYEPWRSSFPFREMRRLEDQLRKMGPPGFSSGVRDECMARDEGGYTTQLRSECFSQTLLCSIFRVREMQHLSLDIEHSFRYQMDEERNALHAVLHFGAKEDQSDDHIISVYATHFHHENFTLDAQGVRRSEASVLLKHAEHAKGPVLVASDFNQARRQDYDEEEWKVVAAGLASVKQPEDDGVHQLFTEHNFRCAYDVARQRNWPISKAPPFTHWTGTTVDYPYVRSSAKRRLRRNGEGSFGWAQAGGRRPSKPKQAGHV